jgi:hemerythrin
MEEFVTWEDRYGLGIPVIDEQHRELLRLTNALYDSCREGKEVAQADFKDVIHSTVDYVKFHFTAEEKIMEKVNYPESAEHKKEHESFVKKVIEEVKNFESGKSFVPNTFVRFLREWILTHIAVSDKKYAEYIQHLKKQGNLNF